MTTTFDALQRLVKYYEDIMEDSDYNILSNAISAMHDLQHEENSHRIDSYIERMIIWEDRFTEWRYGRVKKE